MILVRTHKENDFGFSNEFPPEIVVVDSTQISIEKVIDELSEKKRQKLKIQ